MASYFQVPEQYAGKSLNQIGKMQGVSINPSLLALGLGISPDQPLQSGKNYTYYYEGTQPGNIRPISPGSREEYFLKGFPGISPSEQFAQEQRGRVEEFTGRLGEVPTQLEAVRQALGIPQAYQTFGAAGEAARGVANLVTDIPQVTTQAAQGRDVSANQLQRMIAAKTLEAQPALTEASRGLEVAGAGLSNLLSQYQTETAQVFKPFEIEAGLLGDNIAQEFGLFKTQIGADLDRELANLARQTQLDVADINRAIRLSEIEAGKGEFQDLGNRVIYTINGEELFSYDKGKLAGAGTGSISGELITLWEEWLRQQIDKGGG